MADQNERTNSLSRQRQELLSKLRDNVGRRSDTITKRTGNAEVAATALQQGLWFIEQIAGAGGAAAYHLPVALRLRGPLDAGALAAALTWLAERHEPLRTTFDEGEHGLVQVIAPPGPISPRMRELSPGEDLDTVLAAESTRPFDLRHGPLFRTTLIRLGAHEHVLQAEFHHIVADGESIVVFVRELARAYVDLRAGRAPALPPLAIQFADYAAWQHKRDPSEGLAFWADRLAGAPTVLELPTDFPRPVLQGYAGAEHRFELPTGSSAPLRELARTTRATPFMLVAAAFQAVLGRYCGQDDVLIGCPVANRTRPELEPLIGMLLNTVVLRGDLSGDPSFRELLGRVRDTTVAALDRGDVPFDEVVRHLRPERGPGHNPLVQVMIDVAAGAGMTIGMGDLTVEVLRLAGGEAKFDLVLDVDPAGAEIGGTLNYRTDLFTPATVARLAGHLSRLLEQAAAAPDQPLSTLDLLDAGELDLVTAGWNDTGVPAPSWTVPGRIRQQAAETPDAVAVSGGGADLTYAELLRRADRLAGVLRAAGAGPEVPVAVCLDRTTELPVAVLAVLLSGSCFVPLDPEHPRERLTGLIHDCAAPILLTTAAVADSLGTLRARVIVPERDELADQPAAGGPDAGPANLAFITYTSGSTGRPKAAMNTHAAIAQHLAWVQDVYRLTPDDRVLHKTPLVFDDAVRELLWPLICGARIVLAPPGTHRDPVRLMRQIAESGVTVLHLVPSLLEAILDLDAADRPASRLRLVMTGGEALSPHLFRRHLDEFGVDLVNHYGPTEAAVDVTRWPCVAAGGPPATVPIGRPGANTRIYLLDDRGRPVPIGVPGELHIAGAQVGRGYLGRPGLTAAAFCPDPYAPGPGARMYRTGDRARWRADGVLEYVGRSDDQVKVRGYRIEPAEIEHVLRDHPGVRDAVVGVREDTPGDRRLVAHLVPAGDDVPTAADLGAYLGDRLPRHMIPAAFVACVSFPRLPSGKLDRRALPAPPVTGPETGGRAPGTPAEVAVAGVLGEVFGLTGVGADDDFFALGGHSLLATKVVARLRAQLGVDLPVNAIFLAPTVAGLARRIDELAGAPDAAEPAGIATIDRSRYRVRRSELAAAAPAADGGSR